MKELKLKVQGGIWMAEHLEDGKPDQAVADLFDGYHILPTPFLESISVNEVKDKLRRLNPDVIISFSFGAE